jgi:hypothetical protein
LNPAICYIPIYFSFHWMQFFITKRPARPQWWMSLPGPAFWLHYHLQFCSLGFGNPSLMVLNWPQFQEKFVQN